MYAYVFLPFAPFGKEDINRLLESIKNKFTSYTIRMCCHSASLDYYKNEDIFGAVFDLNQKFNLFDKDKIEEKLNIHFNANDIVIVAQNCNGEQIVKISSDKSLKIYRWTFFDRRIAESSGYGSSSSELGKTVFGGIGRHCKEGSLWPFAYGYIAKWGEVGYINDMGYRAKIDYEYLLNRGSDVKVIAIFGGSACFSIGSYDSEVWSVLLEGKLNVDSRYKYIVLNFGMMGHGIIDETIAWMLYAEAIKPDFVISYSGFNDIVGGMMTDPYLKSKYAIHYNYAWEEWAANICGSSHSLSFRQNYNSYDQGNTPKLIVDTYIIRLTQFRRIVESSGSSFIHVFQPILYSKKSITDFESRAFDKMMHQGVKNNIDFIIELYRFASKGVQQNDMKTINLHEQFSSLADTKSYFYDLCHTTPDGDAIIADFVYESLKGDLK